MRLLFLISGFVIGLAIAAILFALQNKAIVAVNFGVWTVEEPLSLVILLTLSMGCLSGLLISTPTLINQNRKLARQRKRINELEQDYNETIVNIDNQRKRIEYLEDSLKSKIGASSAESEPQ
ncbi:MAG: LapA family protein [Moorea sp. SIO4A3]|nr:LapA family protein [Moorena sp. SIO4A3]